MFRILSRYIRCQKGVAAVEYALITPVLFTIMLGITDYGMYTHKKMLLQDLSRSAAQYVVAGGNPANVQADVIEQSPLYDSGADPTAQSITFTSGKECTCSNGVVVSCTTTCANGDYLRSFFAVTVDAVYTPIIGYPGFPATINMQGYSRLQYNG